MILAETDTWVTHIGAVVGGALTTGIPVLIWAWKQKSSIATQQVKDAYEMDKIRRSDAYQELLAALADGRKDRDAIRVEMLAQDKRIVELQKREVDCQQRTADQDIIIYKEKAKVEWLEQRVKTLEALATSPTTTDILINKAVAVATELIKLAETTASDLNGKAKVQAEKIAAEALAVVTTLKTITKTTSPPPEVTL